MYQGIDMEGFVSYESIDIGSPTMWLATGWER